MSLRFILGRAGTGKTHTCLEEIRQAVRQAPDGPPLILLVPEQATFQTESELTATPGLQGIMRVQVLSFHRLAYRVLLEAGGCARRHLGELGKHMLLREFLERRRQELKVFQRSARQTGFVEVLATAISELKAYEISPGELNGSIEELGKNRGMDVLADKLTDLQLIYRDLQAYLADKYVDPDDYLELLAERIPESDTIRGAEIWLDGFTGFTPVEYTVLRAVLRVATQVNVSLCLDSRSRAKEEGDLFFTTRETEDKLTKLARELGIPLAKSTVLDEKVPRRLTGFPVGAYLESAFYHRSAPVWASETAKIQLAAAVNRRAEVEGAAREIIRLGREEGYRWRDISLALRDLEPYKDLIPTVFSDYGIPYFIDKKRTVMHHPLVELVRSALETVLADWGYDPVFRYLKTDLVPLSREQVDRLENYVLAHGVHGGRWIDGRPWDYCRRYTLGEDSEPSKAELDELNQINQDRVQAVAALATLETAIKDAKTVREYTTALFGLLDDLQVAKTLEEWCKQAESSGQLEKAREHSQIWQEVMDLFDQIVQALGDESLSLENYAQVLNAGLESLRLGLIPPGFDQVLVNSLDRSRNPNVRAVFVLGANDGVLPAKVESTGIFTEQEREELEKTGLDLAPGGRRRLFEEQFIVYTALTRASDRLWVSYPLADEEGKALMPSIIISRLKELLPGLAERLITLEATGEADLEFVCHPGKALSYLATELREANGGRVVPQVWQMVYNWLLAAPDYREQLAQVIAALTKGNQECPLTLNTSQKLYGARLKLSVSRVEQYKACPFAYFLAYGLRLREREQYKLGAPDLGEFFHAALKLFGERINRQGLDWGQISDAECIAVMAQIVEELAPQLQNEILLSTARYHYLVEKLKRTLDASVLALVEQARRGNFRPVGLEIGFGPGEALPPLVYNLKNGIEVELDGRIDRIDLAKSTDGHNYLRVIDYKSGQAELSLEDVYHGLKLQLLTYLDVALTHAHILTGNEAEAGGMLYFRLRDPVISTDGPLSAEDSAKSILNEFKQKGFVLADANLVKLMDNRLVNGKRSEIIPVSLKTQGGFYTDSGVLTADNFALLRKYVQQQLAGTGEEILAGRLEMAPYQKRGRNACQYCRYKPVCRFDTMRLDNKYRLIRLEPKDKLWSRFFAANEGDIDG